MKHRDLPKRMHFKDGAYYHVFRNKWTHLGGNKAEARMRYARVEHGLSISPSAVPSWATMEKYLYETHWRTKRNAIKRGIEFNLSREEYNAIVKRADGFCEVTGIPFEITTRPGCERRPFAPSIDRIESSKGYTPSNCRLVCGMVNTAMGAWGEGVFWSMVRRAKRRKTLEASGKT